MIWLKFSHLEALRSCRQVPKKKVASSVKRHRCKLTTYVEDDQKRFQVLTQQYKHNLCECSEASSVLSWEALEGVMTVITRQGLQFSEMDRDYTYILRMKTKEEEEKKTQACFGFCILFSKSHGEYNSGSLGYVSNMYTQIVC
ncbi:hypothetical protein ElyMa_002736000 [Elysia marginata]|uniref:Uncharacterized protein n=1 Tax=Elysia marginata TaxID=1093978 RepID=A0AAV4HJZ8_9GAST|nr:hypothetical protein ElyMa_002736000 [Elysia marginata]